MLSDSAYYGRENSDLCDEHNIKPIFKSLHVLMFSVVHDLKSYVKCIELEKAVMKRVKISLIIGIYRTGPPLSKNF